MKASALDGKQYALSRYLVDEPDGPLELRFRAAEHEAPADAGEQAFGEEEVGRRCPSRRTVPVASLPTLAGRRGQPIARQAERAAHACCFTRPCHFALGSR